MGIGVAALSAVKILTPFLSSISWSGMPTGGFCQGIRWVTYRGGSSDSGPGWIATLVVLAPVALKLMSRGKPCDSERI